MNNEKLGQENAFPYEEVSYTCGIETRSTYPGMSKRFYAACAAMQISPEIIGIEITDEDVEQDDDGAYVKSKYGGYYSPTSIECFKPKYRFKAVTSYNYRYVRALYEIADELLKQEYGKEY